jgi:hypothetical protein
MEALRRDFSRLAGALLAGTGLGLAAQALPDQKDPNVTLYERPPKAAATPAPAPDSFPALQQDAAGYWLVSFQHLASFSFGRHKFSYDEQPGIAARGKVALLVPDESDAVELPTEPGTSGPIPANVLALDGRRVCLTGYMLPIRLENGLVKDFLLLRNQMMCCYGRRPELNEWVVVKMAGPGVPNRMDTPLKLYGTLHVGEKFENQVFEGLYLLDGEKISPN